MNRNIQIRFDQARLYLDRIRADIQKRDPIQAMADAAELGFQANALYAEFAEICRARKQNGTKN